MVKNRAFGQIMDDADNFGFFKILRRADSSSEILRGIPRNFIRSISSEEIIDKMVLKVSRGSSWTIKICRNPNPSFYFMEENGWVQFLSDNGLGNDEFLTFTHKGNMCFHVDIYQTNAMELIRPCSVTTVASSSSRNKKEQRQNIYKDVKREETESSYRLKYPGSEKGESSRRGLKKAEEAENSKKKKKMKVETAYNDSEDDSLCLVPQFTITIQKSYLLFLCIPKKFEVLHMPKETTMFKIHDQNGNKSWDVTYKWGGIQTRFCAGWTSLAKELCLEIGDVCTFTLIKPTEMLVKVSS